MTREEAIDILHGMRTDNLNLDDLYTKDKYDALGIAIEALNNALVANVPCEDAISRQAYIERYRKWFYAEYGRRTDNEALAIRVAMSLPPVTPQPETGYWIYHPFNPEDAKCSKCLFSIDTTVVENFGDYKYCPNCGTKMIDVPDTNIGNTSEIPTGSESQEGSGKE